MKMLLLMYLLVCAFNVNGVKSCCDVEGYFWRDYFGTIPSDSFAGGSDNLGYPIYIGQALRASISDMVIGPIRSTTKIMTSKNDQKEERATRDVKILCTMHPEQFQWVVSRHQRRASILEKGQQFVGAGYSPSNNIVVVGRAKVGGEVLIGNVRIIEGQFDGIKSAKDGRGFQQSPFELLVYNPSLAKSKPCCRNDTINYYKHLSMSGYYSCVCDVGYSCLEYVFYDVLRKLLLILAILVTCN